MKIKKTINAYNNLLKISNAKNKQFQQYVFNDFLEEQNLRIKQGKSFDINGSKGVIKQLTYPKIISKNLILLWTRSMKRINLFMMISLN